MAKIRLFRLTNPADDETSEFIDFNIPGDLTENTKIENAFIRSINEDDSDGVGNNQGAETALGDQQALSKVEDIIVIDGFFSKRDGDAGDGNNSYIATLRLWASEDKINDDWELGRFGLIVDDDHNQDVEPDISPNTIALLWAKLAWKSDFTGNRENFILTFRVNKG